jgi:hypothetical protein
MRQWTVDARDEARIKEVKNALARRCALHRLPVLEVPQADLMSVFDPTALIKRASLAVLPIQ